MYKLQLILKYLLKRRIAWVALAAVMLCTAMVLVVFSVMNGWLQTFKGTFHGMTSDVVVVATNPLVGFPYYDEIARESERKVPGVAAAEPTIQTYGLLNITSAFTNGRVDMAQVIGYPPTIGRVSDWPTTLHGQAAATAAGRPPSFALRPEVPYKTLFDNPNSAAAKAALNRPGMIVSDPVVDIRHGNNAAADRQRKEMLEYSATVTLLPVSPDEAVSAQSAVTVPFWIVDDAKSRVYALDNQNVYVAFDELQRDLRMTASAEGPARCSEIMVKARPGADLNAVRDGVEAVADRVISAHPELGPYRPYAVQTWEKQQGPFIRAVESEVVMTTALFGIISMVAVLLIFCIFYMIVVEKTRDIGIIKSFGATGGGIMALFLGYGLAIGVVGATLGVAMAFAIVLNINELHAWLGREFGVQIWSPESYQFDTIPNHIAGKTVAWTVAVALVAAVLGALVPAFRAAGMNPVDSLRYE